jgi:Kdo2-lipid IVA lauroyltransferase/acyltransferase
MKNFGNAIIYYSLVPFLYFFSILPWPVLFVISDITFVFLYYVIGYRRRIVMENLTNSFPEKSRKELKSIEFRFYRFFTDMIFEILKLFTLNPEQKLQRCKMDDATSELFKYLYSQKRSVILVMGHYGNWEYCPNGLPFQTDFKSCLIYHPLSNPYFDRLMSRMRESSGCRLYTMTGALKGMISNRNELNITAFLSDQAPNPKGAHWMKFLNQETPVFNGSEKIALKLEMAVVYGCLERVKRGKYVFHSSLICEDASEIKPNEITEKHVQLLEKDIRNTPEYWLWTHRRWKHQKPNGTQFEIDSVETDS